MPKELRSLPSFHRWFGRYCRPFIAAEQNDRQPIGIKIVHCQRVRQEIALLAKALGLDGSLSFLAELTGLFHDLGRFEQFKRYRTFVDLHSTDHAELSVTILTKENIFSSLPTEQQHWILAAIANHNKASIDPELHSSGLLLAQMIRDADKLDIWRVFIDFCRQPKELRTKTVVLNLPDTPGISAHTFEDIMAGRLVKASHITNQNDFAVMRLGWVFDIYFRHSFQKIERRGYLNQQQQFLPDDAQTKAMFTKVRSYVQQMATSKQRTLPI